MAQASRARRQADEVMETLWFCLVALMIAAYVVLDGFDLGAGIVAPLRRAHGSGTTHCARVDRTGLGRQRSLAAGRRRDARTSLFPPFTRPASAAFYLPLMIVLWLLILRGISIELRSHVESVCGDPFWDAVFSASPVCCLPIFFGAALGNVVRGVPLRSRTAISFCRCGRIFCRGPDAGILDWYTILIGVAALLAR